MKVLAAIGLLAIIFAVVAALYFFGGFTVLQPTGRSSYCPLGAGENSHRFDRP